MERSIRSAVRVAFLAALLGAGSASAAPTATTAPFDIDDGARYVENSVMAASRTSGNFVVVWRSAPDYTLPSELHARLYAAGGIPFGPEFKVLDAGLADWEAVVAMNGAGQFVIGWTTGGVFNARVFAANGLPLGAAFRVDDAAHPFTDMSNGGAFSVALASNGTVYAAWRSAVDGKILLPGNGTTTGVFLRRYATAGTPLDAAALRVDVPLGLFSDIASPKVKVAGDGRAVVSWTAGLYLSATTLSGYQRTLGAHSVFFRRYGADGKAAGLPVDLGIKDGSYPGPVASDMNDAGEFVIGWATDHLIESTNQLVSQRFSASGVLKSTQKRTGCDRGSFPCKVMVALDGDGNSLLAGLAAKSIGNADQVSVFSPSGALGLMTFQGEADISAFFGNSIAFGPAGSFIYAGLRGIPLDVPPFGYSRVTAQIFTVH